MRVLGLALTLGMAVGCSSSPGAFQYESSMYDDTRGFAFDGDDDIQAGMFGNTCQVDVNTAVIGQDVNVATNDDHVMDAVNGLVLVNGENGIHFYDPMNPSYDTQPDIPAAGTVDGALIDSGVVTVADTLSGLQVAWNGDAAGAVSVPGASLDSFTVDRATGTAYVTADGAVTAATVDGTAPIGAGDMASWDDVGQVLYVADSQGSELRGLESDGSLRFAVPVDGQIISLDALDGEALVSVARGSAGALLVIDGDTGALVREQATPSAADQVRASDSGNTMAVSVRDELMFFRVRQ